MGVLDDGNAQAFFAKIRDDTRQERRLAGAAPPRKANHLHVILRRNQLRFARWKLYIRLSRNVMLRCAP
jgi:hypothetical protein